jgi:hypothetical protein
MQGPIRRESLLSARGLNFPTGQRPKKLKELDAKP